MVGDLVHTLDGTFSGRIVGRHGAGPGAVGLHYYSNGVDINLAVYMVEDPETHEVRFFTHEGIEASPAD